MQFKSRFHMPSRLFAIAGVILMLSLVAWAHLGQDMKNMPGMSKKSSPQKKRATTKRRKPVKKHKMANIPGMNMPQPNPSPAASPQKMEMNMPGMQMPAASPNPQASLQQKMGTNMPMPAASPGARCTHGRAV